MTVNSQRVRRFLAGLITATLVVAACSRDEPSSTPTTSVGPSTSAASSTSTTAPPTSSNTSTTSAPSTSTRPSVPVPTHVDANGFDDHSVPRIESTPEFFALARTRVGDQSVVKFTIPNMAAATDVHWMDSNFYNLHDEWLWFRLLNGQPAPASGFDPVRGLPPLDSIADIYEWADRQAGRLPLDLRWVGSRSLGRSRLYSPAFYRLALDVEPRNYGVGAVIHFAARDGRAERWLLELEYSDDPTPSEVAMFFETLTASLPAEIGDQLEWVIRSPAQGEIAQAMAAAGAPYSDRIVRFSELVTPGEVAVYNQGLTAGRLLYIGEGGAALGDAGPDDIVILESVPGWLPPGRALISSDPQTPLAHVNLLARDRGIPNASQAGITSDAGVRQAARVRAPAIVRASRTGDLEIVLISEEEYNNWQQLGRFQAIAVPPADTTGVEPIIELDSIAATIDNDADIADWRPVIGGKAAGFLTLLRSPGVTTPPEPVAITVEPYFEHMAGLRTELDAVLGNTEFSSSARIRHLVLEGRESFDEIYTNEADAAIAETFERQHPPGTQLGTILASDGFVEYLEDQPIDPVRLSAIVDELIEHFDFLSPRQGLRFRSSSSVEDIDGFTGAGLYDSNTGFLYPESQTSDRDRRRTVEHALQRTWASYWGIEAFEERRRANIDHRSGAMAVLVHPRFDDELEAANGVATLTYRPGGSIDDAVVAINVQAGAVSVANPDEPGVLPEIIEVTIGRSGIEIERISRSTLLDEPVLDDSAVSELTAQLRASADQWRDDRNASLVSSQQLEVISLDFEFKTMAAGWPARRDDRIEPARLVVKQVRSLDPGSRSLPVEARSLPVPLDVLTRARLIESGTCVNLDGSTAVTHRVTTDPLAEPDMGFSDEPMVVVESGDLVPGADCAYETIFSTPAQFLIGLLEAGPILNLER